MTHLTLFDKKIKILCCSAVLIPGKRSTALFETVKLKVSSAISLSQWSINSLVFLSLASPLICQHSLQGPDSWKGTWLPPEWRFVQTCCVLLSNVEWEVQPLHRQRALENTEPKLCVKLICLNLFCYSCVDNALCVTMWLDATAHFSKEHVMKQQRS